MVEVSCVVAMCHCCDNDKATKKKIAVLLHFSHLLSLSLIPVNLVITAHLLIQCLSLYILQKSMIRTHRGTNPPDLVRIPTNQFLYLSLNLTSLSVLSVLQAILVVANYVANSPTKLSNSAIFMININAICIKPTGSDSLIDCYCAVSLFCPPPWHI